MDQSEQHADGIKQSIESIIGGTAKLRRKKKSGTDFNRELFEKIVRTIDEIQVRSALLYSELGLDYNNYDEKFWEVIDGLLVMHFGKEASELVFFYLYERTAPDGSINELVNSNDEVVPLETIADLWDLITKIQSKDKK